MKTKLIQADLAKFMMMFPIDSSMRMICEREIMEIEKNNTCHIFDENQKFFFRSKSFTKKLENEPEIKLLIQETGLNRQVIKRKIRKGTLKTSALKGKRFALNGYEFTSLKEACNFLKIKPRTLEIDIISERFKYKVYLI
ncbi:MAG: hypothetical protein H7098_07815 [Oligoflexus sp.]|nr:hypothetical protein [Pseudopedobacter sp.]